MNLFGHPDYLICLLYTSLDHQYQEEIVENQVVVEQSELLLYNDDVNTFDHVINMLCKYCDHDFIQAEQCASMA